MAVDNHVASNSHRSNEPAVAKAGVTLQVSIDLLDPSPYQYRVQQDAQKFEELKASIKGSGQLATVIVRRKGERYELITGHRRLRAMKELFAEASDDAERMRFKTIRAEEYVGTDEEFVERTVIEDNAHRENPDPLDDAAAIQQYMARHGLPATEAAKNLHFDYTRFRRLMRIGTAPAIVQKGLRVGIMVPVLDESGQSVLKADGSPKREHRHLDLMAGLEFTKLYEHWTKTVTPKKADAKMETLIQRALLQNWGFRRIQAYVASACQGGQEEPADAAPAEVTAKRIGAAWKETDRALTIYKAALSDLSDEEKRTLCELLRRLMAPLASAA
jgi:ParB/RepB/Spo0J family partition protein